MCVLCEVAACGDGAQLASAAATAAAQCKAADRAQAPGSRAVRKTNHQLMERQCTAVGGRGSRCFKSHHSAAPASRAGARRWQAARHAGSRQLGRSRGEAAAAQPRAAGQQAAAQVSSGRPCLIDDGLQRAAALAASRVGNDAEGTHCRVGAGGRGGPRAGRTSSTATPHLLRPAVSAVASSAGSLRMLLACASRGGGSCHDPSFTSTPHTTTSTTTQAHCCCSHA